jgi:hypothetical protein
MEWTQDPRVLWQQDSLDFYPPKHWKQGGPLLSNSMARLIIILSVLYSIVHKSYMPILGGLFALGVLAFSRKHVNKVEWPPTFETTPTPKLAVIAKPVVDDRDKFIQAMYPKGVGREMDFSRNDCDTTFRVLPFNN